jgi:uncharacterized protein (UPF0276 family)
MAMGELPWMGLGLSSNLNASDVPHPYRLLERFPGLFDYVEYSAPLSIVDARREASLFEELWERRLEVPVLFHPVHLNLYGPTLEPQPALSDLTHHLAEVGSPWVSNDVAWWHQAGQPFPGYFYLPPPFDRSGLHDCTAHALHVQAAVSVPLVLENPAVIACRGGMHVLDFMAQLHRRTGLDLLLDLGHLFSYQLARGIPIFSGLDGFPLDRVVEIHLAGGMVTGRGKRRFYVDDHSQPLRDELLEMLASIVPRCDRLRAVTLEADGLPPGVVAKLLQSLRSLVPRQSAVPVESAAPTSPSIGRPSGGPSNDAWGIFDQTYDGLPDEMDPTGASAELDFRLAVIAEELDRWWPLTRILIAATRQDLMRFAASTEFRSVFEPPGKDLAKAFAAFARRSLRDEPDPGLATVLAFETWANAAPVRFSPTSGEVALADGLTVKTFPVNMSELLFAARAVKNHLSRRAWVTGEVDYSGLESIRQVARRAPSIPWPVAIRRLGGRIEVIGLTEELLQVLQIASHGGTREEFEKATSQCFAAAGEAVRLGLIKFGSEHGPRGSGR